MKSDEGYPGLNKLLDRAVNMFGKELQSQIAMEECAELIQAISKIVRKPCTKTRDNLIEEMADVILMMEQLLRMYDIKKDEVEELMYKKLDRLKGRLDKGII